MSVIDDVGLVRFDRNQANAPFQVINRRYEQGASTIVTANSSLSSRAELFGGERRHRGSRQLSAGASLSTMRCCLTVLSGVSTIRR